jgi:ribosomal protein S18 acetylase RimI-like enzyme
MTAAAGRVTTRPLEIADRARVESMTRAVGLFREEEIPVAVEVFEATALGNDTYEGLAALQGGEVVGWISWGPTPGTLGTFDLYWIVIDPACHGQGIGTVLVLEMERVIQGRARLIIVETAGRPDYESTREFYRRRGYEAISVIPDFYAPGDDKVTFVKRVG